MLRGTRRPVWWKYRKRNALRTNNEPAIDSLEMERDRYEINMIFLGSHEVCVELDHWRIAYIWVRIDAHIEVGKWLMFAKKDYPGSCAL